MWMLAAFDSVRQDLRYSARLLRRTPFFTATAVLSLAAGIGAVAAAFNVADAVLFRPLPARHAGELFEFRSTLELPGTVKVAGGVPEDVFDRMQAAADFADLVGFRVLDDVPFDDGTGERLVRVELVSANYFQVLGVATRSGRGLDAGDGVQTPLPVVLSGRLGRSSVDPGTPAAGRDVSINGIPAGVAGVTADFQGLIAERPADVFVPLSAVRSFDGNAASMITRVVVRLRPGVTPAQAEQRLAALYKASSSPSIAPDAVRIALLPAARGVSDARATLAQPLLFGLGLAVVLLAVACANTGGLLVTRFAARRSEFGVRLAVGASRARLARQLLVESAVLASLGAAAGLLMASLAGPLLMRAFPVDPAAAAFDVRFDWRLVAFTAAVSGAAALAAACASLFRALRADPATVLHGGGRSIVRGRRRLTQALIAAQVACSLLLLVAGASMLQTLGNLRRVDPGFDAGHAFAVRVDSSAAGVEAPALPAYFTAVHERILSAPGVGRASFAQLGLMTQAATTGTVDVPGRAMPDADRMVRLFWVGPHFFEAAGMRLVAGRTIGEAESSGSERVAVVNQAFARHYFGAPDAALGRVVNRDIRIIGIVHDARYNTLRDEPVRAMFLPHTQAPPRAVMTFVVRPSGEQGQAVSAVAAALRAFGPRLKVRITPLSETIDATVARERFVAGLAAVLSALALFLSCAGLYAAVTQGVAERKTEVAVRLALGATGRDVIRLILTDPLRTTLIGIALGVPVAYGLMRSIASLLFGVAPFEPVTVVCCALFLVAVTALAAFVPARRATGIDPQECLKTVS